MQFVSLSSGSSGNCYYIQHDGYGMLVDLGIGIRIFKRHCQNYGIKPGSLCSMLVTHDHTDHVKAVGALSSHLNLPVYTSEAVHQSIQRNDHVSKKVPRELQHILTRHTPLTLGPFTVTQFAVPHDSADNNGYLIACGPVRLVIATDIGHFTDEIAALVRQATHLVVEANYDPHMLATGRYPKMLQDRISGPYGHISNAETGDFLAQHLDADLIRHVWLCHLSEENNTPSLAFDTVAHALREAHFRVNEADGLKLDVLPRRTPTLPFTL